MKNPIKLIKDALIEESAVEGPVLESNTTTRDPLLSRGAIDVRSLVAPQSFVVDEFFVRVGTEYCRTLWVMTYPPNVHANWLSPLFLWQEVIDISLFVNPLEVQRVLKTLRGLTARDEAELLHDDEQGRQRDFEKYRRYGDMMGFIEALENDATKPFQVSLLVTLRAPTLDQLDAVTEQLRRRLTMCDLGRADLRQKPGFLSTLPLLDNRLADAKSVVNMHTDGVQTMFPMTSSEIAHPTGVMLGVNMITKSNVTVDRFMQPMIPNPSMAFIGVPGSGKSYSAKMEMMRWNVLHGVPVIVIDPQAEYERLCRGLGGQFIDISPNAQQKINPLDFTHQVDPTHNALQQKLGWVIGFVEALMRAGSPDRPPLSDYQRSILEKASRSLYGKHGYSPQSIQSQMVATSDNMPLLVDLYDALRGMARNAPTGDGAFQHQITPLIVGLSPYVGEGAYSGLFNSHTTVDLANDFIVFNIQNLDDSLLPIGMHMVLEFLRTGLFTLKQMKSGQPRLLYVDEAQRLMDYPESARFLSWVIATSRKFNIGISIITQNVENFLLDANGGDNKAGRQILANCSTTMLLRQHSNTQEMLAKVFRLSPAEAGHLSSFGAGQGLLIVDNERCWLNMAGMSSPMEHRMITTTAKEVATIERGT